MLCWSTRLLNDPSAPGRSLSPVLQLKTRLSQSCDDITTDVFNWMHSRQIFESVAEPTPKKDVCLVGTNAFNQENDFETWYTSSV